MTQSASNPTSSATLDTPRKPTVMDVAKKVGLSHTAVSLALRGRPGVSPKQQQRIREAAAELGYQPKAAAQMLRSGRTGYIGLILEPGGPEVLAHSASSNCILTYFLHACQHRQRRYNVEFFHQNPDGFEPPHQLAGSLVDGMLLGGFIDAQLRKWLLEQPHYKWVSVDEPGPYAVLSDINIGLSQAVKQLYDMGHRRIAYGGGPYHYRQHEIGRMGYLTGMSNLGLSVDESWIGRFGSLPHVSQIENARNQRQWVEHLLKQPNHPTAFIGNGIGVARNTLVQTLTMGLRVPEDISIMAVGVSTAAMDTCPAFATIENDYHTIMKTALDMLVQLVDGKTVEQNEVHVNPVIVMRESVGPAKA
ncbi:MAG: LacI family DNA-binding transcriptional regulator [Phycisphaeraceae bacterium JB051]